MHLVSAFLAGSLFGLGLLIAGMTDTTKVQGWLDIFGSWDPTLAFVMGGAILPMAGAWAIAARIGRSTLGIPLPVFRHPVIERPLVVGSALFGAGWALAGLCPGPAMASLSFGGTSGFVFFAAMIAGMILSRVTHAPSPVGGAA